MHGDSASLLLNLLPSIQGATFELVLAAIAFVGWLRLKRVGWLLLAIGSLVALLASLPWVAWNAYQFLSQADYSRTREIMRVVGPVSTLGRLISEALTVVGLVFVLRDQLRSR